MFGVSVPAVARNVVVHVDRVGAQRSGDDQRATFGRPAARRAARRAARGRAERRGGGQPAGAAAGAAGRGG